MVNKMADLKQVYMFGVDLQKGRKYATTNFVTADNTLISKIKDILATLGLYNPNADSAANKLIPILRSDTFTGEYQELNDVEKQFVVMAVYNVLRRTSKENYEALKSASADLFDLANNDLIDAQLKLDRESQQEVKRISEDQQQRLEKGYQDFQQNRADAKAVDISSFSIDGGEVEEESAAAYVTAQAQNADRMKRQQDSNARTLHVQLTSACSLQGQYSISDTLNDIFSKYETPKVQMQEMISYLKETNHSSLLSNILKGDITEEELLSGAKHLATVISERSQIK